MVDIITRRFCTKKTAILFDGILHKELSFNMWKIYLIVLMDVLIVGAVLLEVLRIAATNTGIENVFYAYRIITSHTEVKSSEQYMNAFIAQAMKVVIVSGFLFMFIYLYNIIICSGKFSRNFVYLIPPILLCAMTLMCGVRTNILRLCVYSLICSYILMQYKKNWSMRASWRFIKILVISLPIILFVFSSLQTYLGRSGETDLFTVISNYAGASIQHFNQYMIDPAPANEVLGQKTFSGIWNFLYDIGAVDKTYSSSAEFRYLNENNIGNVYTFFRSFLHDFGYWGMCLMTAIVSVFFSLIYNHEIRKRKLTYKRMIYLMEYGYLYYIITMFSIDNVVHDYIKVSTIVYVVLLHGMCWFIFKVDVKHGRVQIRKKVSFEI